MLSLTSLGDLDYPSNFSKAKGKHMFFFLASGEGDSWSRGLRWHLGTAEFQPMLCRGVPWRRWIFWMARWFSWLKVGETTYVVW